MLIKRYFKNWLMDLADEEWYLPPIVNQSPKMKLYLAVQDNVVDKFEKYLQFHREY